MITTKELAPYQKKVSLLAEEAKSLTIGSKEDLVRATVVLSNINKYMDSVKEKKETLTKPINTALKNIRAIFKPLEETYEEAILAIRGKMTKFQTEELAKARAEEEKIASRVKEGKGNLSLEKAMEKIDAIDKPEKEVATDSGLIQFREIKRFEVVDISKLPIEYHTANEKMIGEAMKQGKEVQGVRYFTEQVPVNYR